MNPHRERPPIRAGAALDVARVAAVLVHGRGQDARFMLDLVDRLALPLVAYVLPEAAGGSWYPDRFNAPAGANEPALTHALGAIDATLATVAGAGVPVERTVLVGFSQGACLLAEHVFRAPAPYAGLAVLTGALIGPPGPPRTPPPGLDGLAVFCGCARADAWVPLDAARATATAFAAGGARVTLRDYDEPEHAIYADEVDAVRALLTGAEP